tara:strand:- start:39 stop:338 length:300 start_codon:yes stop_codon:yes gene_type:complete
MSAAFSLSGEIAGVESFREGDIIGICSENRVEWVAADLFCLSRGYVCASIPHTIPARYTWITWRYGDMFGDFGIYMSKLSVCLLDQNIPLLASFSFWIS